MTASLFIPTDLLSKLVEGSFETRIRDVSSLVEAHKVSLFGSETVKFAVHGTYANHAVLVSDSKESPVVRIRFGRDEDGDLVLEGHERVSVTVYDVSSVDSLIQAECARAVEELFNSDLEEAGTRMQGVLDLIIGVGKK